jgi:hypothetical protein
MAILILNLAFNTNLPSSVVISLVFGAIVGRLLYEIFNIQNVAKKQTPKDILETELMAKKYTEEDIRKVIDETIKACNISQKESYGDLEIDTDKIINSLNKQD